MRYLSSSSSTLEGQWQSTAKALEQAEIGSLSAQQLQQGARLVQSWSQLHTKEGTALAWRMLDRLYQEEHILVHEEDCVLTTSLIGALVNSWVIAPNEMTPRDVLTRVRDCEKRIHNLWADVVTYNMIIDTAIKRGDPDAHALADEIMHHVMEGDGPTTPTTILFNTAINAHAKSNNANAPQRGEELLQKMRDLTDLGCSAVAPDSVTFGTLISTWANSGQPGAAKRAVELLMESPETQSSTYNAVMNAWAKHEGNEKYSLEKCLQIFDLMKKEFESGRSQARPNAVSYGTVIGLLAKQGRPKEAEEYLMELLLAYDDSLDSDLAPTRVHFNSLIDAWSRTRDRDAPKRADSILCKMQRIAATTGNPDIVPDVVTFTIVLQTLAMSRDRDAASRADAILKQMWDLYDAGNTGAKPNTRTYNKVLDCWLHSSSKDTALKAEGLLRTMQKRRQAGDDNLQPDTTTYALVLDIWSKSRAMDAPERVEALLDEMEHLSTDETVPVALNKILFNMAIITWSRSGRVEALERAEKLFERAIRLADAGWEDMQPNTGVYNAMLSVLAKSRDPAAKEKTDHYLSQLNARYRNGDLTCKPDTVTYNTLLDVLSNSRDGKSFARIEAIMHDMESLECKPDQITLNCMIKCISRDRRKDKAELAWNHVNMMMEKYSIKPSTRTLNEVLSACARSSNFDEATREKAFRIAILTFRRIFQENEPDAFSFRLFFSSAAGLNQGEEVEIAWKLCQQRRLHRDPDVVRALQVTAPHLLRRE